MFFPFSTKMHFLENWLWLSTPQDGSLKIQRYLYECEWVYVCVCLYECECECEWVCEWVSECVCMFVREIERGEKINSREKWGSVTRTCLECNLVNELTHTHSRSNTHTHARTHTLPLSHSFSFSLTSLT